MSNWEAKTKTFHWSFSRIDLLSNAANMDVLTRVSVEYETLPGWCCSTEAARSFEDLPVQAQKYIRFIEDFLQVPGSCTDTLDLRRNCSQTLVHFAKTASHVFFFLPFFMSHFSEVGWSRQVQREHDQTVLIALQSSSMTAQMITSGLDRITRGV